ncbi:DUF4013 domain-containing protein [Nanoarchaeota archaeon]
MTKMTAKEFKKDLSAGLKYPWGEASRLWNILWILLPIFGWLALVGYLKKIVRSLVKGDTKKLPKMDPFWKSFVEGVVVAVFMIPTAIALGLINAVPFFGAIVGTLISIFLLPWLTINFFEKETFNALWEIKKGFNKVFDNAVEYIFVYLKTIVFAIIYTILMVVLVGIPCATFGRMYFLAAFYNKHH